MDLTQLNKDKHNRRKTSLDLSTMVYGKVPPQSKDAEMAVLGACMMDSEAIDVVMARLKPEAFYVDRHQRIYNAMRSLAQKSSKIDVITVVEELKAREDLDKAGGPYYVAQCTNAVTGAKHIESHCQIIQKAFLKRELIRIGGEMIGGAYEDDSDSQKLLEEYEGKILAIGTDNLHNEMTSINEVIPEAFRQIEEWREHDTAITGIPSGVPAMDRATRGWQPKDFIVLAARPSVGKTAFALQLARNAVKDPDTEVAIFSLEMGARELVFRLLAAESETYLQRIQTGRLNLEQMEHLWVKGGKALAKNNIHFDEAGYLTIYTLIAKFRRLRKKREKKTGKKKKWLIIIDYLQLMSDEEAKTREQEVSRISRGLKRFARQEEVPVIALSQLNRALENRAGKKREPQLSDLRESGSIEQDADVVGFLWGPEEDEVEENSDLATRRYWKIGKQRSGVLARGELEFQNNIQVMVEAQPIDKPKAQDKSWKAVPGIDFSKSIKAGDKFNGSLEDDEPPF